MPPDCIFRQKASAPVFALPHSGILLGYCTKCIAKGLDDLFGQYGFGQTAVYLFERRRLRQPGISLKKCFEIFPIDPQGMVPCCSMAFRV